MVALAMLLPTARSVSACPTCSEAAAANDPEHEHMVKGYFYSILFMMGVPYTVFFSFAGYMYWEVKKARARKAAEVSGDPSNSDKPLTPAAAAVPTPDVPRPDASERRELVEV